MSADTRKLFTHLHTHLSLFLVEYYFPSFNKMDAFSPLLILPVPTPNSAGATLTAGAAAGVPRMDSFQVEAGSLGVSDSIEDRCNPSTVTVPVSTSSADVSKQAGEGLCDDTGSGTGAMSNTNTALPPRTQHQRALKLNKVHSCTHTHKHTVEKHV